MIYQRLIIIFTWIVLSENVRILDYFLLNYLVPIYVFLCVLILFLYIKPCKTLLILFSIINVYLNLWHMYCFLCLSCLSEFLTLKSPWMWSDWVSYGPYLIIPVSGFPMGLFLFSVVPFGLAHFILWVLLSFCVGHFIQKLLLEITWGWEWCLFVCLFCFSQRGSNSQNHGSKGIQLKGVRDYLQSVVGWETNKGCGVT